MVWFDRASAAASTNTGRRSEPHALTVCKADLPRARSHERPRTGAIDSPAPCTCAENSCPTPLSIDRETDPGPQARKGRRKASSMGTPCFRLRMPGRNQEGRNLEGRNQEGRNQKERTLSPRRTRAMSAAPAPQVKHTAQSDDQQLVKILPSGIAGPRVLKSLPVGTKLLRAMLGVSRRKSMT